MGRRKHTGNFIDEQQLLSLWEQWKKSSVKVNMRTIPEQLVEMMYIVADHLLEHQRFVRYPPHMKEDMRQEGVLKCIKNLKNFKQEKGKLFSYFTTCCWTAFVVYLSIHYKEMNKKREQILEALNNIDEKQLGGIKYLNELLSQLQENVNEYGKNGEDDEGKVVSEFLKPPSNPR